MHGILIYVVLAVFISGLMVVRTPEYLGKKFEAYDVKMAMVVASRLPAGDSRIRGILIRQWLRLLEHNQPLGRTASARRCTHLCLGPPTTALPSPG